MEWHVATLTFLPAAFDDFRALADACAGRQDLVGAVPVDQYKAFAQALGAFARIRDVRNLGTAVALLTRIALDELARHDEGKAPTA